MGTGDLAPEDGDLAVGAGVHDAADALDGLADVAGRGPLLAALEGEVFDEVGHTGEFGRLVPGTGANEDGDGNGLGMGHHRRDDAQLVAED